MQGTQTKKSKIFLSSWMLDMMKWFMRWVVKDLLVLSSDAMKHVISTDRLLEAVRMKWQDAKMSKLEYCKY